MAAASSQRAVFWASWETLAAVHLPELDEEREQDALQEQVGDQPGDAVHRLPGNAVLGHAVGPGVLLEEKEVGLVVDDGRDFDKAKHQAQLQGGHPAVPGRAT